MAFEMLEAARQCDNIMIGGHSSLTLGSLARMATAFDFDADLVTENMLQAGKVAGEEGLLRLPDRVCWVEFTGFADPKHQIAPEDLAKASAIHLALLMFHARNDDGVEGLICIPFYQHPKSILNPMPGAFVLDLNDGTVFTFPFPQGMNWGEWGANPKIAHAAMLHHLRTTVAFIMSLQCKDVEVSVVGVSERIRRKREQKKLPPIIEYKKLTIKQHLKAIYAQHANDVREGRALPRFHFVRSHLREYKSGHKVVVVPYWRGHADKGTIIKDYEIRKPD